MLIQWAQLLVSLVCNNKFANFKNSAFSFFPQQSKHHKSFCMEFSINLWIEYLLRFSHLVAGIAWIGSSFYFIWLDSSFTPPETPRKNVEGEVFMVHGGFYYQVEKKKIYPGELPKVLHWFKWEATLTWATGFALLVYLYFMRGASLLVDAQVFAMSQGQAVGLSLTILVLAWFAYDLIWNAKIIRHKTISALLSIVGFVGMTYFLTKVFSGRGAFMLTGGILGSLMLLNVWIRILPGQAKMIQEARSGLIPDYSVSLKSKIRSVHNTYFIFPVLFIMLSNHTPTIYNHKWNWALLILLSVSGAMVRHSMVTKITKERWLLLPAAIGLMALVYMTALPTLSVNSGATVTSVEFAEVQSIIQKHCLSCHASHPTDEIFKVAPLGLILETESQLRMTATKVYLHVVQAQSMPLGNKSNMTIEERNRLSRWLIQEGLVR